MNAIFSILTLIGIPIMVMNLLGGIVSGVWLAFLGEWKAIGLGILSLFCATFIIGFALMPSLLFALPAAKVIEKGKIGMGMILGMPAALYTVGVMIAWCYVVFRIFDGMADESSRVPMLIWSYGVATGPWAYMAQKESQGDDGFNPSVMHTFFISTGYLLMIIMTLVFGAELGTAILGLCVVMAISFVGQLVAMTAISREQRLYGSF